MTTNLVDAASPQGQVRRTWPGGENHGGQAGGGFRGLRANSEKEVVPQEEEEFVHEEKQDPNEGLRVHGDVQGPRCHRRQANVSTQLSTAGVRDDSEMRHWESRADVDATATARGKSAGSRGQSSSPTPLLAACLIFLIPHSPVLPPPPSASLLELRAPSLPHCSEYYMTPEVRCAGLSIGVSQSCASLCHDLIGTPAPDHHIAQSQPATHSSFCLSACPW